MPSNLLSEHFSGHALQTSYRAGSSERVAARRRRSSKPYEKARKSGPASELYHCREKDVHLKKQSPRRAQFCSQSSGYADCTLPSLATLCFHKTSVVSFEDALPVYWRTYQVRDKYTEEAIAALNREAYRALSSYRLRSASSYHDLRTGRNVPDRESFLQLSDTDTESSDTKTGLRSLSTDISSPPSDPVVVDFGDDCISKRAAQTSASSRNSSYSFLDLSAPIPVRPTRFSLVDLLVGSGQQSFKTESVSNGSESATLSSSFLSLSPPLTQLPTPPASLSTTSESSTSPRNSIPPTPSPLPPSLPKGHILPTLSSRKTHPRPRSLLHPRTSKPKRKPNLRPIVIGRAQEGKEEASAVAASSYTSVQLDLFGNFLKAPFASPSLPADGAYIAAHISMDPLEILPGLGVRQKVPGPGLESRFSEGD